MSVLDLFAEATPLIIHADDLPRLQRCIVLAVGTSREAIADDLEDELRRARVLPGLLVPPDVVVLGARVTFEDETTRVRKAVVVVLPDEADAGAGRVSVLSPVGAALIGLRVGQRIAWALPHGQTVLRVVGVEQPRR
jgi:regulator of nucleoside diphosphate kinase